MRIKRFVGETLKEATEQMRTELGSEAIILNTRKVANNRFLNFVGKEMLEITAAIDDQAGGNGRDNALLAGKFSSAYQQARIAYDSTAKPTTTFESLQEVSKQFEKKSEPNICTSPSISIPKEQVDIQVLRNEMEEMRSVLLQIADHLK